MWWSNGDERRQIKDSIKNVIKRSQVSKKKGSQKLSSGVVSPPGLSHSVPTSDAFSDSMAPTRDASVDSPFKADSVFAQLSADGYFALPSCHHVVPYSQYPAFSPYEVDIKTERQIFVNDVPTRRDSTISTFSTFQPPPASSGAFPADSWVQQDYFESHQESLTEEPVNFDFFEYPQGNAAPAHETVIDVEELDKPLLKHFLDKVSKLIFPVLDTNQHGSARSDAIMPALESNKCFLHCCLSIAGIHKKSVEDLAEQGADDTIMRHRYATISELCDALSRDTAHTKILQATLGMIFFPCLVGRPDDALPDIPWHQHFQAATSLVEKLELQQHCIETSTLKVTPPPAFNMTLVAWIDILGSTMLGRSPLFADTYRELNISGSSLGLAELMGCDDHIMFLISEIACLEARMLEGMEEVMLCKYIEILGTEIGLHEPQPSAVASAISATGAVRSKQLKVNMTAVFRIAARIYLCSMIPGFSVGSPSTVNLVTAFDEAMGFIPAGQEGFDRSLVWPLLVAGSVSLPSSLLRATFAQRCSRLGDAAGFGSFGRLRELLKDIWRINDTAAATGDFQSVHWRGAMHQRGWDLLLI